MKKWLKRFIVIPCIICVVFLGICLVLQLSSLLQPGFFTLNINPEWNTTHTAYYDGAYYFYRSGRDEQGEICCLKGGEETSLFACNDTEAVAVGKYGIYLSDQEELQQYDFQGKKLGSIDKSRMSGFDTCTSIFIDDENNWLYVTDVMGRIAVFDCKSILNKVDVSKLNNMLKKQKVFEEYFDDDLAQLNGKLFCSIYELGNYNLISCCTKKDKNFSFFPYETWAVRAVDQSSKQVISITDNTNGNQLYPSYYFMMGSLKWVYADFRDTNSQLLVFSDSKEQFKTVLNFSHGTGLMLSGNELYTIGKYHYGFLDDLLYGFGVGRDRIGIENLETGKTILDHSLERGEHIIYIDSEKYVLLKGRKLQIYHLDNNYDAIKEYRIPFILPGYQYVFEVNHHRLFLYRIQQSAYDAFFPIKRNLPLDNPCNWKYVGCYEL